MGVLRELKKRGAPAEHPVYLTYHQVSMYTGISENYLRTMNARGKIPDYVYATSFDRYRRFHKFQLLIWLSELDFIMPDGRSAKDHMQAEERMMQRQADAHIAAKLPKNDVA